MSPVRDAISPLADVGGAESPVRIRRLAWPGRAAWAYASGFAFVASMPGFLGSVEYGPALFTPRAILVQLLVPQIAAVFALIGWSLAGQLTSPKIGRVPRLVLFVAVALVIAFPVSEWLTQAVLGLPDIYELVFRQKGEALPPRWVVEVADFMSNAILATFAIVVAEMWRTRRGALVEMRDAQAAAAAVRQRLLEAQLSAMQAQVEPQFLFDALVDIEAAYASDSARANACMDRLFAFLHLALPGMRETGQIDGTMIGAELAIVDAYLAILRARNNGGLRTSIVADDRCRVIPCFPMLLLPLVQALVPRADAHRHTLDIEAALDEPAAELRLTMSACPPAVPTAVGTIDRVRERLNDLYSGQARLQVVDEDSCTRLSLVIPVAREGCNS